jgi:hypothetical protein
VHFLSLYCDLPCRNDDLLFLDHGNKEPIPCLYAKLEIAGPQFLSYNLFRFNRRCLLDLMIG